MRSAVSFLVLYAVVGCHDTDSTAVSTKTPSGGRLHWATNEIVLTLSPERPGQSVSSDLAKALTTAAATWNRALAGCKAPKLLANLELLDGPLIKNDRVNSVLMHETRWCPPSTVQKEDCYSTELQARTHLYPRLEPGSAHDGELRGVDLEINAVDYRWSETGSEAGTLSLRTMFVHELGHVLGLDHPCGPNTEWSGARKPLLSCDTPAMKQGVMHPSLTEYSKDEEVRPSRTEVAAVCAAHSR